MPNQDTLIGKPLVKASQQPEIDKVIFIIFFRCQHKSIVFLNYLLIDVYLTMGRFLKKLGREPSLTELSRELNMGSQEINDIKLINSRSSNLNESNKTDYFFDLAENIPDTEQRDITDLINEEQCKKIIANVINSMKPNNRTILTLRYGLNGDSPLPREQIGMILGLTGERVRQIEANALKQLARNSELMEVMKYFIDQQKNKQQK